MNTSICDIFEIEKINQSKLQTVDFETVKFGNVFSDHMLVCDFTAGEWQTPKIMPYQPFTIEPSAKVFHYGQAIFEGMKAYKDEDEDVWLFRPDENFRRFNKSAKRLAMPEIPEEIFIEGIKQLVSLDKDWVKKGKGNSLYIRPFMIATGNEVVASPSMDYKFIIILSPAKSYYSGKVKVIIAEHYSRAANGGIGAAKAAGNYSAQFYPQKIANSKGFQQVIWTDDATHTKLEEAGTMNVFFYINNTLITAPVSERILDGVTRKSLIQIAKDNNTTVEERPILVSELVEAAAKGTLHEIFGAGTAAVVNPIVGFSYKDTYYELPKFEQPISLFLKEKLTDIQYNQSEDLHNWRVLV